MISVMEQESHVCIHRQAFCCIAVVAALMSENAILRRQDTTKVGKR